MSTLYITVGIPGSGKSTYVKSLYDVNVVESDAIREELFGSADLQYTDEFLEKHGISKTLSPKEKKYLASQIVFDIAFTRCREALIRGNDVVLDATNISKFARKSALSRLKGAYSEAVALYFNVSLEDALENNNKRLRHVPEDVIKTMHSKIEIPALEEGFSCINVISNNKEGKTIEKN